VDPEEKGFGVESGLHVLAADLHIEAIGIFNMETVVGFLNARSTYWALTIRLISGSSLIDMDLTRTAFGISSTAWMGSSL
jgi:hypothetical protein